MAFTAGIVTGETWRFGVRPTIAAEISTVKTPARQPDPPSSAPVTPETSEIVFDKGRLKIIPDTMSLKNQRLRYEVNIRYPQIIGSKKPYIKKLNRQIASYATGRFQWLLSPSKSDLRLFKKTHPEAYNSVNLDYEVRIANDSLLSIYFLTFSYGIGAAHSVQTSHVINYDLIAHKELKLSDIFSSRTQYLEFIASYCTDELSKHGSLFMEKLPAKAAMFENWNMYNYGISFTFDACELMGCADGKQQVDIPLTVLFPWLKGSTNFF